MSSRRIKNSASVDKSTDTPSAPAAVATPTGRSARSLEICRTVGEAMKALSAKKTMDWTKESPEIAAAEAALEDALADYVAEKATREEVKKAYKAWADLHEVKA